MNTNLDKNQTSPNLIPGPLQVQFWRPSLFLIQAAKRPLNYCQHLTFQTSDKAGERQPKRISGYSTQMVSPDLVQNKSVPKVQTPRMQEILSLLSMLSQGF